MTYNFDEFPDRTSTNSFKWHFFEPDVLPMWVADMDFLCPPAVRQAVLQRAEHGIFGYPGDPQELHALIAERMMHRYGWQILPEDVLLLPGVIVGFNLACQAVGKPGDVVLYQTPVYMPFLEVAKNAQMVDQRVPLAQDADGRYSIDFEAFESAITPNTRVFILCNPHNPVGRVFEQKELEQLAEICLRHNLLICSDEIHSDLVFSGHRHIPIASLSPEVGQNSITLIAPSKTFNIAGLQCSAAVIPNPELRQQFQAAKRGLVSWVNLMGLEAGIAAYREGDAWLSELMTYLEGNRDYLMEFLNKNMPEIRMVKPEGTYLAWLDCREAVSGNAAEFFLKQARVGMNDGAAFGAEGEGFVRLNFGCPRSMLSEALERMKDALQKQRG